MMPIIQIVDLTIGYQAGKQAKTVLDSLNVSVNRGELIGIIGQNGIGKSTLLRTIARLQKPLKGKVMLEGRMVESYSRNKFAERVSFVSTEILKLNHCTVRQMISFGRSPYTDWFGNLSRDDQTLVDEAMDLVGITSLSGRYINEISDGERQRVMIARALAQDTEIIVLDEPTAFLDMPNKYEVVHLLGELSRQKNKTILFTSHDLNIAMREADRLWLITPNSFVEGAPEDLVLRHAISGLFDETRLKFDARKGEFSIRRKPIGACKLNGKGTAFTWTRKAMERLGYDTENEPYSFEITVEEKEGKTSWSFDVNGTTKTFFSISDLVMNIKQL